MTLALRFAAGAFLLSWAMWSGLARANVKSDANLYHSFSRGERLIYSRVSTISTSGGVHKHSITYTLNVISPNEGTLAKAASDRGADLRGAGTFSVRFNNGAWLLSDGTPQYDFGLDRRLYCDAPAALTTGLGWDCNVTGLPHWLPSGHATIKVVSINKHDVTLDVSGNSNPSHAQHIDNDTGKQYESIETMRWHERLTFHDGVLQENVRDAVSQVNIANLNLVTREHTDIKLTSHSG